MLQTLQLFFLPLLPFFSFLFLPSSSFLISLFWREKSSKSAFTGLKILGVVKQHSKGKFGARNSSFLALYWLDEEKRCSKTLPCCWLGISLWNLNTGLHVRQHRFIWKTIVTAETEALIDLGLLSPVCLEVTFKLSSYFQMVTCLEVTFKQINVGCEKKTYLLWGRFIICKIFK